MGEKAFMMVPQNQDLLNECMDVEFSRLIDHDHSSTLLTTYLDWPWGGSILGPRCPGPC